MRANTDRALRLTFGQASDTYAVGRPMLPPAIVGAVVALCGLSRSSSVVEIGPGTGQLTMPLIEAGLEELILVEPDVRFAPWLRRAHEQASSLVVVDTEFESAALPAASFDAILACDSFHWLDPSISYAKCRRLLSASGRLGLVWTFPWLTGPQADVAADVVARFIPGLMLTSDAWQGEVCTRMAEGEVEASVRGPFRLLAACSFREKRRLTTEEFSAFVLSYAAAGELEDHERAGLIAALRREMGGHAGPSIELERRIEGRIYAK